MKKGVRPIRRGTDLRGFYRQLCSERRWRFEGAVEGCPIGLIIGPEKVGHKSWILIDMAIAAIAGREWLGAFPCRVPGPVVYVDSEYGPYEFTRRVARVCRGHGLDPEIILEHLHYFNIPELTLCGDLIGIESKALSPKDRSRLKPLTELRVAAKTIGPSLVVVDPLRNLLIGNENDTETILNAFRALGALRDDTGAPVMVAHHVNKQGGYSGSRAILTRGDLIIEGTDENPVWWGAKGRSIRNPDPIAKRFTVRVNHTNDADDLIAATRLKAKFEGERGTDLSPNAERFLELLQRNPDGLRLRQLRERTKTNNNTAKRALSELGALGLASENDGVWSVELTGFFGGSGDA